jgi:hypothetical protein
VAKLELSALPQFVAEFPTCQPYKKCLLRRFNSGDPQQ